MSINLSGRALKRLRLPVVNYYSSAYQVMSAQAGDVNTRYLDVVLYDDRGDIDLGAYSKVYLQVQAYDGISPQMSEGWIDTERNRAVCRLTSSMLQYTGSKMPCNIWLVGTDADAEPMSLTSQTFYVMVYEGHGGADAEPSEDELTALQSAITDVVELEKTVGEAEANRQENFRSVYIKYSFDANGYNYTDSWQQGQQYMGVANTPKEPEDATGYSWIIISGGSSGGSAVTVVGKNGYGFYRLAGEYTADTTNVATEDIQRRADREVQAGDMLITPEGLIFVLDEYDADNDTQKVSYYTDIGGGDVSEEAIAAAVEMYMSENEIGGSGADDIDIVDSDGSYKLVLTKDGEHIGYGVNMPTYTAEDVGAAEKEHNHDEQYQPKGNYAAEGHDHDGKYQPVGNYLTEESDPTVPSWAKQPTKPTYTADEVNARPNTWMPTAEDVGARPSTWTPTASDVGADAIDTAATKVTDHNAATDSHNDIRLLIQGLDARLTALADSDDTTLDQLSELVAYIKENRDLIGSITTNKVNVDAIINNLTTNATDQPLSAAQGVALKALIDNLTTTVNGKQTAEQVATAISNALKAYPTTTAMQTAISTALADYVKSEDLGDMAAKDTVSETDLDTDLKEKVNAASEGNHSHNNKAVLDGITAEKVEGWDGKADANHNHDGKYQPKGNYQPAGNYAPTDHNHDGVYQPVGSYLTQHQSLDHLLPKNQGAANAWKIMVVGEDGSVIYIDKASIVQAVIESLGGQPVAGYFEEDNGIVSIVLTSALADGDYTIKYEMGDNTYTLGTVTVKTTVNKYTVTFVADGVTVKVVEYEEGATSIDPNDVPAVPAKDGFTGVWDSYTLDDTNITVNAVYTENAPAVTTYGVTLNGTNCTSNGASSVNEGAAYTAKLTPSNGKNMIYTASVKMGGDDITDSAYNSATNTVNIAKVTGKVEITARAIKNLLPLAVDVNGNDYVGSHANGGDGWDCGIRVNSTGAEVTLAGMYCTGFMPCALSSKIRIKNVLEYTADNSRNRIQFYNSSKSNTNGTTLLQANTSMTYKDGVYTIKPSSFVSTANFFRFACGSITADTIVTVDEEL